MLDRIALAKAGYKKKEIEEMLSDECKGEAPEKEAPEKAPEKEEAPEKAPEKEEAPEKKSEDVSDKVQEELLKAFEEQKEQIADLQKQLKEAQSANTRQKMDVPGDEDKEEEIIKILMEG